MLLLLALLPVAAFAQGTGGESLRRPQGLVTAADFNALVDRRWPGPMVWTNRLQDWSVRQGRLFADAPPEFACRTAHLLTYALEERPGGFATEVAVQTAAAPDLSGFAGFLVGAGEGRLDYRAAALVHQLPGKGGGLLAVVDTGTGKLSFRDMSAETNGAEYPVLAGQHETMPLTPRGSLILALEAFPAGAQYVLRLSAWDGQRLLGSTELNGVAPGRLRGNIALVSHRGPHTFDDWRVGGERLAAHPERVFGPIAGTLYSVSDGVLKLSAQFFPLAHRVSLPDKGRLAARLEQRSSLGEWRTIDGPNAIAAPDYYVPFRVEKWDATRDSDLRVAFEDLDGKTYTYSCRVRRDPIDKPVISVAGFTGMGAVGRVAGQSGPKPEPGQILVGRWTPANIWAPFADAVANLKKQNLDYLFFTGDQIYQGKPSATDESFDPEEDYLYKWLIWHWSFRDLTSHLPASVQPDDHDVYQGNIWGWGGRLNVTGHNGGGGYMASPYFVNLVQRLQSGHMPDAFDPKPILNGITTYYTRFTWGGVGFAVLEDRKFKTPGHIEDPAQQVLLGEGQHRMLREWGEDWRGQQFKCVVSQTIYASMHVGFDGKISSDRDTGGFPKIRRDEALHLFRRCGAFILGGDQHLSTFARLGIEKPSDAVYQFAVPAMGNIFWRWFYPAQPGRDPLPSAPGYTGDFTDGYGNHFRMIAVANPERRALLGQQLRQRYLIPIEEARQGLGDETRASQGDGYGILRFDKKARTITVESWPHEADPTAGGKPFFGWPVTLPFEDLDGRQPAAWLPDLEFQGAADPVVQIIDETTGEAVKITRASGGKYSPPVFDAAARYTLRAGVPERNAPWWERKNLRPGPRGAAKLLVRLQ